MISANDSNTKSTPKRRDVLRYLGLGVIASGFGLLFHRAWENGQCIGHSQCGRCMANTKCELPLAIDFRNEKVPRNQHRHDEHKHNHKPKKQDTEQTFKSEKRDTEQTFKSEKRDTEQTFKSENSRSKENRIEENG